MFSNCLFRFAKGLAPWNRSPKPEAPDGFEEPMRLLFLPRISIGSDLSSSFLEVKVVFSSSIYAVVLDSASLFGPFLF